MEQPGPLPDEWCMRHFDHLSEELAQTLPATMARMRALCPVTHSDAHDEAHAARHPVTWMTDLIEPSWESTGIRDTDRSGRVW